MFVLIILIQFIWTTIFGFPSNFWNSISNYVHFYVLIFFFKIRSLWTQRGHRKGLKWCRFGTHCTQTRMRVFFIYCYIFRAFNKNSFLFRHRFDSYRLYESKETKDLHIGEKSYLPIKPARDSNPESPDP